MDGIEMRIGFQNGCSAMENMIDVPRI